MWMMSRQDFAHAEVHSPGMRIVQVSELKERLDEVIEAVRNGEIMELWEGEVCIAAFVPKVRAVDRSVEHPDPSG
ncbi:MAG: hypothetical protein QOF63_2606 [Thermoanaerobaculia bacterium]|jgi:antitoxin (DNA-binding transcriptional repressor) of toxin-antitoxin stability system|nr:hypothetical protein [Thermoanaerobaculia bacterium]MEA2414551.1 hypothetical protein [Thermoanaerobaculia bacterium]